MNSTILTLLALCAMATCAPMPQFLAGQPQNVQQGFIRIETDNSLTQNQKYQQLEQWAQSNNLSSQYANFRQQSEQMVRQLQQNSTRVINNLLNVQSQLVAIFENDNQTGQQRDQAVQALKAQYPDEVPAIFCIWKVEKNL